MFASSLGGRFSLDPERRKAIQDLYQGFGPLFEYRVQGKSRTRINPWVLAAAAEGSAAAAAAATPTAATSIPFSLAFSMPKAFAESDIFDNLPNSNRLNNNAASTSSTSNQHTQAVASSPRWGRLGKGKGKGRGVVSSEEEDDDDVEDYHEENEVSASL